MTGYKRIFFCDIIYEVGTSLPCTFWVYKDSLYLKNHRGKKWEIVITSMTSCFVYKLDLKNIKVVISVECLLTVLNVRLQNFFSLLLCLWSTMHSLYIAHKTNLKTCRRFAKYHQMLCLSWDFWPEKEEKNWWVNC